MISFVGPYFILTDSTGLELSEAYWPDYAFAVLGALVWASYSALTRSMAFAADRIAIFLFMASLITLGLHWQLEAAAWPAGWLEWGASLALVDGLALMLWDDAMKRGNVKLLASLAYTLPLLSSLILLAAGLASYKPGILTGAALIITGCLVINFKLITARVEWLKKWRM